MQKLLLFSLSLLLVGFNFTQDLDQSITNTIKFLLERQNASGSWSGAFVSDASNDAMTLPLGKKLGFLDEKLKEEIYRSVIARMDSSKLGWPAYFGGPVDRDVTGMVLLSLHDVGYTQQDPNLKTSWLWFRIQGGPSSLRPLARGLLLPLGLIENSFVPRMSPRILGLPEMAPFHINKLGGYVKEFVVPFLGWRVLSELKDLALSKDFLSHQDWLEAKSEIGTYKTPDVSDDAAKTSEMAQVALANSLVNSLVGGSEAYWAKQALAYSLQERNPSGTWYSSGISMVNLMLLREAHRVGLGDFSELLRQGWQGILKWRAVSAQGFSFQQVMGSDIWDTSLTISALHELKDTKWSNSQIEKSTAAGLAWLKKYYIPGRGWSFDSTDQTLADLDDTATVLHALTGEENSDLMTFSLDWILENQNDDGGFPAWGKGVSKGTFSLVSKFFKDMPDVADVSQPDVTARILYTLAALEKKGIVSEKTLRSIRERACEFILEDSKDIKNINAPAYIGHWYVNYVYAASQVALGISYGNCHQKTLPQILAWIVSVQNSDGGWGEDNSSYAKKEFVPAPSTLSQTAFILHALIKTYEKLHTEEDHWRFVELSIQKGMNFLIKKSRQGTDYFEPQFGGTLVKNSMYARYELLPAYMSLYTFGSWVKVFYARTRN